MTTVEDAAAPGVAVPGQSAGVHCGEFVLPLPHECGLGHLVCHVWSGSHLPAAVLVPAVLREAGVAENSEALCTGQRGGDRGLDRGKN